MTDAELIRKCAVAMGLKEKVDWCVPYFEIDGKRFDPLGRPAHWMMLVEFAQERGYGLNLLVSEKHNSAVFVRFGKSDTFTYSQADTPGRAVALSFVAAFGDREGSR